MDNPKVVHGVYSSLIAIGALLAGGGTYIAKDSTRVMGQAETQSIIKNELAILKIEQLKEEKELLREEVRRDMRITSTERLATQNEGRLDGLEDEFIIQKKVSFEILEEVKK